MLADGSRAIEHLPPRVGQRRSLPTTPLRRRDDVVARVCCIGHLEAVGSAGHPLSFGRSCCVELARRDGLSEVGCGAWPRKI